MKVTVLYIGLFVVFADLINAKSITMNVPRERRFAAFSPQLPAGCTSSQCNRLQANNGCPAMCVRWNTVLNSNGQIQNTPAVASPLTPGDNLWQCPQQCQPRCCNTGGQLPAQPKLPQALADPPACIPGCPRACYPACRPGCCNLPQKSSFLTAAQNYQAKVPMTRPIAPFAAPQLAQPAQGRSMISHLDFSFGTPRTQYAFLAQDQTNPPSTASFASSQPGFQAQRSTIPHGRPMTSFTGSQYAKAVRGRATVPHTAAALNINSCPVPCSPMCAPHCTRHCCESYD